jgi:hypothetical protein
LAAKTESSKTEESYRNNIKVFSEFAKESARIIKYFRKEALKKYGNEFTVLH